MALTIQQVKEILSEKTTKQKPTIKKAARQENRLRFHSETILSDADAGRAFTEFSEFVKTLLPSDKYRMFLSLFQFPVNTVTLTDRIYTALHKLFDGRNPVFKFDFLSSEDAEDWQEFRARNLNEPLVWKTKGFETMKNSINSIIVADLPSEQTGERPEPYFYFLDIESVIEFNNPEGEVFDWLMFWTAPDRIAVFDDESFRVFETIEESSTEIKEMPISESFHDLGYCPARFFWSTPVSYKNLLVKKSPLSNILGKLDMLLFYEVSNEHLNLYGRYPIYSVFASDCDYEHSETHEYCDGGFLKSHDGHYLMNGTKAKPCPICESKRLDGPGSLIEIDPPGEANDKADLRNPVQITSIPRESLDYNNEDIQRRRTELYSAITGNQGAAINDKAINESQVLGIFQGLEAALEMPQRNFEKAMTWTDKTMCLLRYGSTSFTGLSISLGTEHFIFSTSVLMELYKLAKESSFSVSTLDMLEDLYHATEYKNNPEQLQRQTILNNLDPFRHRGIDEVQKMYADNEVNYNDYMVKANFSTFVTRFERENMSVTEFGSGVNFDTKIKAIRKALEGYALEMKPNNDQEGGDLKSILELYAIGVRSGSITPQAEDEAFIRSLMGIGDMSKEAVDAWIDDKGIRRPITLKSKTEQDVIIDNKK